VIIIFLALVSSCLFIARFAVAQSLQSSFGSVGGSYWIPLVVISGFIACIIAFARFGSFACFQNSPIPMPGNRLCLFMVDIYKLPYIFDFTLCP